MLVIQLVRTDCLISSCDLEFQALCKRTWKKKVEISNVCVRFVGENEEIVNVAV